MLANAHFFQITRTGASDPEEENAMVKVKEEKAAVASERAGAASHFHKVAFLFVCTKCRVQPRVSVFHVGTLGTYLVVVNKHFTFEQGQERWWLVVLLNSDLSTIQCGFRWSSYEG